MSVSEDESDGFAYNNRKHPGSNWKHATVQSLIGLLLPGTSYDERSVSAARAAHTKGRHIVMWSQSNAIAASPDDSSKDSITNQ